MATKVGRGKIQLAALDDGWPTSENANTYVKNLADIYYKSRVIANFVPNFVVMATGVDRGKMRLAAFDGLSPKTSLYAQKFRKNLLRKPSYSQFRPKFRCHGNGGQSGVNINDS